MTLRQRVILYVAVLSLVLAAGFSVSLLYLTRSALNVWENRQVARAIEIATQAARDPAEQAEALQGFRAYHQLKAIKGLLEQRVAVAGVLFGLVVFVAAMAVSLLALVRITRPLKELTTAIEQAGRGDLSVRVSAGPRSETGTVARAFNTMTARLRRLQEDLRRTERLAAWRDVARILGHELRNPLTPIRLSVERLRDKSERGSPDLPQVIDRSTRTVLEEIEALDRIVTEFSDFARMPEPKARTVNLNRLLTDVVGQYSNVAPGVEFATEFDPRAEAWPMDPDLMRRVFSNVIKNSIEALAGHESGRRGRIAVCVRVERDRCRVTFTDNGPGIPAEARDRAFEPYFTTKTKGTGLGLAVVRNIVEQHGGEVEILKPAEGAAICLTLVKGAEHEG